VSAVSVTVFSAVNFIYFHTHNDFLPSNVFAPVTMLGIIGLTACIVAALGWYAAMEGNACRLHTVREPRH
jgi:hypothetical protein